MPPHITAPVVGDRFVLVLETYREYLLSVANAEMPGRLAPKAGASDLVQDTLTAALQSRNRFHGRTLADLRAWLRGILANEMAMFRRRYRAACRDAGREVHASPLVPVAAAGPVDRLIRAERSRAVAAAMGRLPDDARAVVVLRLELGLGFREIGDRLGRTEEAARKLYTRALDRLREAVPRTAA